MPPHPELIKDGDAFEPVDDDLEALEEEEEVQAIRDVFGGGVFCL